MTPLQALREEQAKVKLTPTHRYYVDGRQVPGTTTVIRSLNAPQLNDWRVRKQAEGTARAAFGNPPQANEPEDAYVDRMARLANEYLEADRVSDEAAAEGTEVHSLLDWRVRTMMGEKIERPVVSEAAAFREAGWVDWAKSVGLKPLATEFRFCNRPLRYCGTGDLLAEINGEVSLVDYKRSKAVYASMHLQSIAYRMGLESVGFHRMPGYVLLMPPGEALRLERCSDTDETRDAFLSCLKLYNWTNSLKRSK